MIVIASYTANLAAFLTVETLEKPISNAEDLANQDVIKYGVVNGGSTAKFFQTSADPLYQRMGEYMNGRCHSDLLKMFIPSLMNKNRVPIYWR